MECSQCGSVTQGGRLCSTCQTAADALISCEVEAPKDGDINQVPPISGTRLRPNGCGMTVWFFFVALTVFLTWLWLNPWVSAILTFFLLIFATQYLNSPWVRTLLSLALTVGVFFGVSQVSEQDSQIITATSVGPYFLGQTLSGLNALDVPDAGRESTVRIPELEHVSADIDASGTVSWLTINSTGDDVSPPWQTVEGISADSSLDEFLAVYPSAQFYDGDWTMAWAQSGDGALLLTKFGPDQGILEIGRPAAIEAKFKEETAPLSAPTKSVFTEETSGYGWEAAYNDILSGCLKEASVSDGSASDQDRQFCESWAQSNADQYCDGDSCAAPNQ